MPKNWTEEQTKRLMELATERELYGTPTARQIGEILSNEFGEEFTKDQVNHKIFGAKDEQPKLKEVPFMPFYDNYKAIIHDTSIRKYPNCLDLSGPKKILHICDLHLPFEDKAAVQAALSLNAASDIVVISELMDQGSQSTFNDLHPVSLEQEIEATLQFLEFMNENFPMTLILDANHDHRVAKRIAKSLPTDLQIMVERSSLIEMLTRPFKNIYVIPNWWVQLGDALICHADKSTTISMKTVVDLDDYFRIHYYELSIKMPYRVLIQAHVHSLGVVYMPDAKLFEAGMLSMLRDWWTNKPQKRSLVPGYITIYMQDGKSDLNRTREYMLPITLESSRARRSVFPNGEMGEKRTEEKCPQEKTSKTWEVYGTNLLYSGYEKVGRD